MTTKITMLLDEIAGVESSEVLISFTVDGAWYMHF
jgi:hypothetical protein